MPNWIASFGQTGRQSPQLVQLHSEGRVRLEPGPAAFITVIAGGCSSVFENREAMEEIQDAAGGAQETAPEHGNDQRQAQRSQNQCRSPNRIAEPSIPIHTVHQSFRPGHCRTGQLPQLT